MHSNQKSERSSDSTRLGPSAVRVPSATLHVRFTDSGRVGAVARPGFSSCALPLTIRRRPPHRVAVPPRSSTRQFGRTMVLISVHALGLARRAPPPVERHSDGLIAPGGPRLRPCLAGKICFQLSCSEALCDYYNSTGHPTCRPESVYLKPR
jgi:hypothetical protein